MSITKKAVFFLLSTLLANQAFADSDMNGDPQCHLKEPHRSKRFEDSMKEIADEARQQGISEYGINEVLRAIDPSVDVLKYDRNQQVFQVPFVKAFNRRIDDGTINIGRKHLKTYASLFDNASNTYGVSKEVLVTFWGLETAYGKFQGDVHTVSALAQLAHDCRRPHLFRPQLIAAMKLTDLGMLNPHTMKGAWAGEIGQVQMLPGDILNYAVDGDKDGKIDLKNSLPDAIMSAANLLKNHGWRANEPWIKEVEVNDPSAWYFSGLDQALTIEDWAGLGVQSRSGSLGQGRLKASLVAPQGHLGPKFLVYANYQIFLEWNQSFTYTISAAHMAQILAGDPKFKAGTPDPGLETEQMKELQQRLLDRGHDIGMVDGVLGAKTRKAVQDEQIRLGLVSDGWPTLELLKRL